MPSYMASSTMLAHQHHAHACALLAPSTTPSQIDAPEAVDAAEEVAAALEEAAEVPEAALLPLLDEPLEPLEPLLPAAPEDPELPSDAAVPVAAEEERALRSAVS